MSIRNGTCDAHPQVFGREERLGPSARRYQLRERLKRHPDVAAWLARVAGLQALREGGGATPGAVRKALQAAVEQVRRTHLARRLMRRPRRRPRPRRTRLARLGAWRGRAAEQA